MKKKKKNSIFPSNKMRGQSKTKNKIWNCQIENKYRLQRNILNKKFSGGNSK